MKFAPLAAGVSLLGLVLGTTGCSSTTANLRLMNAMINTSSVDMLLDNKSTLTGITYGAASAYTKVDRGSRNLIVESTGSSSPLLSQTIDIPSGDSTVVATSSAAVSFADDNSSPSSGNIKVRVINASPSLGTVDVYVVTSGTSISGLSPTFSSLAYRTASGYQTLAAGSYQVIFTPQGQQYSIYASSSQSFSSAQIRSVVALDAQNGGFTAAILSDLN